MRIVALILKQKIKFTCEQSRKPPFINLLCLFCITVLLAPSFYCVLWIHIIKIRYNKHITHLVTSYANFSK